MIALCAFATDIIICTTSIKLFLISAYSISLKLVAIVVNKISDSSSYTFFKKKKTTKNYLSEFLKRGDKNINVDFFLCPAQFTVIVHPVFKNYIFDFQKIHRKMSKNGHYQKVRRPTGLEVYTDAARILEELLEQRIDKDVRVGNCPKRNKSDPTRDLIRSPEDSGDASNAVTRSKTMPSRYRESSKEEELKKKDLDDLRDKAALVRKKSKDHGSNSSMDTADDDASETGARRRKKSRFKRAVERLKHVFNRDQKEGIGSLPDNESSSKSPSSVRKKPRHKLTKILMSEKKRRVTAHQEGDSLFEVTEEQDYKNKHGSKHTKITSVRDGDGTSLTTLEYTCKYRYVCYQISLLFTI